MEKISKPLSPKSYVNDENRVTYFAETDSRNRRVRFGIKAKDRTRHVYTIGKTGMGKSTLLENMAIQDIQNGEGLAFIDPHGKSAEFLLDYIPKERIKDVLYFAPFDMDNPVSFNVMEDVGPDKRHLVVSGLMSAFKKIWVDAWSARMEYILSNTLLALLEYPGSTLLGINRVLSDKVYRKKVVDNIKDPAVKSFWVDEFAKYTDRFAAEATPAIQNKVGQFTSNPLIRNIIGQPHSSFDLRRMMDDRKIVILNLSKGRVGESNANLLGSMLITKIYLAAMSRADVSEADLKRLPNFYLYVDEFQSFANESFADILSEARKYKLNLTIAHQYVEQMSEEVRAAVFGNVGTMIAFRVGAFDSELLEKEFAPHFTAEDMVNLGFAQIYLKLMIDGVSSSPFSATTMPPVPKPAVSLKDEILAASRAQFAFPRVDVEKNINDWHEPEKLPERSPPREAVRKDHPLPSVTTGNLQPVSRKDLPEILPATAAPSRFPTRVDNRSEKHSETSASHDKFKSDLKDLLKMMGQKDVVSSPLPGPKPETKVETKSEPKSETKIEAKVPTQIRQPEVSPPRASGSPQVKVPENKTDNRVSTRLAELVIKQSDIPTFAERNDKKIPTAENLAGLRAALTAALRVREEKKPSPPTENSKPAVQIPTAQPVAPPASPPPVVTKAPSPTPVTPPAPPAQNIRDRREVPHDAIRKILESD